MTQRKVRFIPLAVQLLAAACAVAAAVDPRRFGLPAGAASAFLDLLAELARAQKAPRDEQ